MNTLSKNKGELMKITGDYHTHSIFSKFHHGKNTIEENAQAAEQNGFIAYGVTDHGPKHVMYGIRKKNFKKGRAIVDNLNVKYKDKMKIYFGIEANIIGKDGEIDLTDEQIKLLDYIVVGYHKGTITNFVQYFFARNTKKQIEKNTKAYINAVNRYNIAFFSHLNTYIKVNVKQLAEACAKRGTHIEINNRHFNFSKQDVKDMLDTDVKFIISSDAHKAKNIGLVDNALDIVKKYNIPLDRIVNIDKTYIPKPAHD